MAGGFFSGGSSDAVNASVAEAEAAAREAEAARDAILDNQEIYGENDTNDSTKNYTVPLSGTDAPVATSFLNQQGDWTVPAGSGGGGAENLSELTDVDSNLSPTNDQILQYNSTTSQFEAVDPEAAGELEGTAPITVAGGFISLDDLGVTTAKLGPDSVTNAKIADNAVQQANIATGAIDSTRLTTDAVTTAKITDDAVTNAKMADDSVDTAQLIDDAVTTAKISDGAITTVKIAGLAVNRPRLDITNIGTDAQVLSRSGDQFAWVDQPSGGGTDNITASNGLARTGNDIAVVSTGLTSTQLATDSVTSTQLADNAVDTAAIADGAITTGKIAQLAVGSGDIAANAVINGKIADGAVDAGALATDSVTTVKIADNAVTNAKIINQAVNEDKLDVSNTGSTGQLLSSDGDGTFTWVTESGGTQYTAESGGGLALSAGNAFSIADDGVTAARLAANAVVSNNIVDGVVTGDKLSVSGTEAANSVIATDGSGNLQWASNSGTLAGLSDTNIPDSITNRRFLEYSPSEDVWDAVAISDLLNLLDLFDVVLTSPQDNQFLRYDTNTAKWVNETVSIPSAVAAGTGISVSGSTVSISDDGVGTSQLADGAVTTAKIPDNAITGAKMADLSVDTAELADGAVTTAKIADVSVTAGKIADNTITGAKVAPNTLTATELATDSVTSFKIVNNAVTADELDVSGDGTSGQVLSSDGDGSFSWVANGSGGETYTAGTGLDLSDGNQFSIAALGVDSAELAAASVIMSKIADGAVGSGKIAAGAVATVDIADDAVTTAKIPDNAITGSKILDGTIATAELTDAAINAAKLAANAVSTVKIVDNAVTAVKLATDIPVSTLSDVNTSGVNNGQILSYNGTTWVPVNNSGGGNTDNSRLVISHTPASLTEGDNDTQVDITLSIGSAITGETISGQSVTVTDPTGHSVAVTGSGNTWMFTGNGDNVGNYVIRAQATFTLSGNATGTVHSATATLPVHADNANWFQTISATAPTAVSGMTDNGVYSSPEDATFQSGGNATNARKAYIAAPTRSGGYAFTLGVFPASDVTTVGTLGDYTLYRINDADFDDRLSGTLIITITES